MVRKYTVTNCNGNCNAENKVRTFILTRNPEERKGLLNSKDTVVCLRHWPKDYTIIRLWPALRPPGPSLLFNCFKLFKSSLLPTVPSAPRKIVRNVIPDELHLFEQKDKIEDLTIFNKTQACWYEQYEYY